MGYSRCSCVRNLRNAATNLRNNSRHSSPDFSTYRQDRRNHMSCHRNNCHRSKNTLQSKTSRYKHMHVYIFVCHLSHVYHRRNVWSTNSNWPKQRRAFPRVGSNAIRRKADKASGSSVFIFDFKTSTNWSVSFILRWDELVRSGQPMSILQLYIHEIRSCDFLVAGRQTDGRTACNSVFCIVRTSATALNNKQHVRRSELASAIEYKTT